MSSNTFNPNVPNSECDNEEDFTASFAKTYHCCQKTYISSTGVCAVCGQIGMRIPAQSRNTMAKAFGANPWRK